MKKALLKSFILCFAILLFYPAKTVHAIEDPLKYPNNKIGIHILFPTEIEEAAKLINTTGGDYGYVTIAIQSGDKDIEKWQEFLDKCKKYHLIPIMRLATEGNYFNTAVWRKPTDYDIVDFANFLNSLNWPYKNRYIIVFNEVNRADEWGGAVNPKEYAEILSYTATVFKSKNPDFFIISAGLDNAAPEQPNLYVNQYNFMRQMNEHVPGIFNQIDGLSSHSYPNPGFSQPPSLNSPMGINSFQYEKTLAENLSNKELPIFITETGWSTAALPHTKVADYYQMAFTSVWNDKSIVAVTPFLLQGTGGPFQKFSLFGENNSLSPQYNSIKNFPKIKGAPNISNRVLAALTARNPERILKSAPAKDFSDHNEPDKPASVSPQIRKALKWLLRVE